MTLSEARALMRARAAMMEGADVDGGRMVTALRALSTTRRTRVSAAWTVEVVLADAEMEASCGVEDAELRITAVETIVRADLARLASATYDDTPARRRWADRIAAGLRDACPGATR